MERISAIIIATLCMICLTSPSFALPPKEPTEGYWLTENERSVIKIYQCQDGLCGNVYWIIDGGMQTDSKNPDVSKRDQAICGLRILWGFDSDGHGKWSGGNIYKADDGDLYSANLELLEDGTLKVRGYLGVSWLGKTQIWTRANSKDYKKCS
ncbi:MAG: DUF2147 domain-containing protein [Bdellovibrionales bacterium]